MTHLKSKFKFEDLASEDVSSTLNSGLELEGFEIELNEEDVNRQKQKEFSIRQGEQGEAVDKGIRSVNGLKVLKASFDIGDDKEILIETATAGWGFAQIGDNQEYAQFSWTSAGVVTLINNSTNAVATDTDAKFCIYDAGSGIAIKNRLGSELTLRYELNYS